MRNALLLAACSVALVACNQNSFQNPFQKAAPSSEPPAASSAASSVAPAEASSLPPASDVAASSAAAPAAAVAPTAAASAAPAPPPFSLQAYLSRPPVRGRMAHIEAMAGNAEARDANGQVQGEQAVAMRELNRCGSEACVKSWMGRREAALAKWQE